LSALQSVSLLQPHVALEVAHTGVLGNATQALSLSEEQTPHWPASGVPTGWQAGSAAFGQGNGPGFVAA
jgi:hypothetical protein